MNLRIGSSNIRFENPADGPNDWPLRRGLWAQMIHDFEPWIFGTQEGRELQLRNAASLIPKYKLLDQHREWIDERMYPCIFYRADVVSILRCGDAWLSQTPDVAGSKSFSSAFPRLCTWAQVELIESKQRLFFINTHLDHVKAQTRKEQIQVVIDTIKKENLNNDPVILTGDFNESPTEDVRLKINQQLDQLIDPWFVLKKEEETSHHKFCGHNPEGARIDWILVDQKFTPINIELDKRNDGHTWPSDHYMVQLTLKI